MGRLSVFVAALALLLRAGSSPVSARTHLTPVTLGLGYFANVQFAPFYVAQARGYYRQAGLDLHFQSGIEPDIVKLAAQGKLDFVNVGGDEVMTADAREGLHVRYILTQYSRFPAALFSLTKTGIRAPKDLRGHSIGVPGPYGASYVGLLVLLGRNRVPTATVSIKNIGFTQEASVAHHQVDAAVGYAMNEPLQLRQAGYQVKEFDIYHWANLAGAGVATGDNMLTQHPGTVRAFVHATLQGLADTLRDPNAAYRISAAAIKIKLNDRIQRAVLHRSLAFWQPEPGHPLGWVDPQIWSHTAALLYRFKQIPRPVSARSFYTDRFIR